LLYLFYNPESRFIRDHLATLQPKKNHKLPFLIVIAMSDKYKIHDQNAPYFITMTTVGWIDVFTRKELKLLIVVVESMPLVTAR
jgi:hypothetical protein